MKGELETLLEEAHTILEDAREAAKTGMATKRADSKAVAQARGEMRAVARQVAPLVADLEAIAERLRKAAETAEAIGGGVGPSHTMESWGAEVADALGHGEGKPSGLAVVAAYIERASWQEWKPNPDAVVRLWAVSQVRHLRHLLTEERSRTAVETARAFALGWVSAYELAIVEDDAWRAAGRVWTRVGGAAWNVAGAAAALTAQPAIKAAAKTVGWLAVAYACQVGDEDWLDAYAGAAQHMDLRLAEIERLRPPLPFARTRAGDPLPSWWSALPATPRRKFATK